MFRSGPIAGRWTTVGLVEEVHELAIARRDLGDSLFARRLLGPPGNQRIPEIGAADRKADEARHLRRNPDPFPHLLLVLAAPENDTADMVASAGPAPPPQSSDNPRGDRDLRLSTHPDRRQRSAARG